MKKFPLFMACAAALVAGLASCSQDRDPVYHDADASSFKLNEPVMQNEYIELQKNDDADIELVASQPDYGYAATARYSAQVSLTEDFAKFVDVPALGTSGNTARFRIGQVDLAVAICSLRDLSPEDEATATFDYIPVYVRAVSQLQNVPSSLVYSNIVKFNHIKAFFSVASIKWIYLVGNVSAWSVSEANAAEIYADWKLYDDIVEKKNNQIYWGIFDLGATTDGGAKTFRFYTQLGDWDATFSVGSQMDDSAISDPGFVTGSLSLTQGKGSYTFPDMPDGRYKITVNMAKEGAWTLTVAEPTPADETAWQEKLAEVNK